MTRSETETSQIRWARLAGFMYLVSYVVPITGWIITGRLEVPGNFVETAHRIMGAELLYRFGLSCQLITSLCCFFLAKGTYVPFGGSAGRWMVGPLARGITTLVLSPFVSQKLVKFFVAKSSKEDLTFMRELMAAGKLTPVIDKRYRLSQAPEAIRYLIEGHARGKVVIALE